MIRTKKITPEMRSLIRRFFLISIILVFNVNTFIFSEEQTIKIPEKKSPFFVVPMMTIHTRDGFSFRIPAINSLQKEKKRKEAIKKFLFNKNSPFSIMGRGRAKVSDLAGFLQKNNPGLSVKQARKIARLYIKEAGDEGVNYEVAFSQMCLETGFLKYGGDVHPGQNNLCGLGVTGKGKKGLSFPSLEMGVRAHIQHLKAYASNKKLNHKTVDARFKYVKRGSVRDVRQLTGKWARDPKYGRKLESLLKRLMAESGERISDGS